MSQLIDDKTGDLRHTDDIQDIITAPPSWLLRWGITLFFLVLILIIALSAAIRYPDIVKTKLKITSSNAVKTVVAKISGRITELLIKDHQQVSQGQTLAYLESTAKHEDVLKLMRGLKVVQQQILLGELAYTNLTNRRTAYTLGELQSAYQSFAQSFLDYKATVNSGIWIKKKAFLQRDLLYLEKQKKQLQAQKDLQQHDFKLAEEEYKMHKKLADEKAETPAELREAESRYLAKQGTLVQTDASIITANANYAAKQEEILELDNKTTEEKAKFLESLNNLISQTEDWKSKYVLTASQAGKLLFAGNIQVNQVLQSGQLIFYINSDSGQLYGEMAIPQVNMGKVKERQKVLIKLHSYPFEEYGVIRGYIQNINDVPYRDSVFLSTVNLDSKQNTDLKKIIHLKQGMIADAEIVTEDASILSRIIRNLIKMTR